MLFSFLRPNIDLESGALEISTIERCDCFCCFCLGLERSNTCSRFSDLCKHSTQHLLQCFVRIFACGILWQTPNPRFLLLVATGSAPTALAFSPALGTPKSLGTPKQLLRQPNVIWQPI